MTSPSSPSSKFAARARALNPPASPKYTASAPFSTAARSWGQPAAGASTSGFRVACLECTGPAETARGATMLVARVAEPA